MTTYRKYVVHKKTRVPSTMMVITLYYDVTGVSDVIVEELVTAS